MNLNSSEIEGNRTFEEIMRENAAAAQMKA